MRTGPVGVLLMAGCAGAPSRAGQAPAEPPAISAAEPTPPRPLGPLDDTARDGQGWLGVELGDGARGSAGVQVRGVTRGSPAARAGLRAGDLVRSIDGRTVAAPRELVAAVRRRRPGERVALGVDRAGSLRLVSVTLERFPARDELLHANYVGAAAPPLAGVQPVSVDAPSSLEALRGRVVVLEFWASWCVYCRALVPVLNGWRQELSPLGVSIVGVANEPFQVADAASRRFGVEYGVAADPTGATTEAYSAYSLPMVFVIDRQGTVRDVIVGYDQDRLAEARRLLDRLLAE